MPPRPKKRREPATPATQIVSVRLPTDLVERVDAHASAVDRSRSNTVKHLLERGLEATRAASA